MSHHEHPDARKFLAHCCPRCESAESAVLTLTRRGFLEGVGAVALGGVALTGLSWPALAARDEGEETGPGRRPLVVKPLLVYSTPQRRHQTSWRSWGGIQTEGDAEQEVARIRGELDRLQASADFPVKFLPVARVRKAADLSAVGDMASADVVLVYAAGGWMDVFDAVGKSGKDVIFFVRHKSGPVYLWYEIISPRYLRLHTDELKVPNVGFQDVVVDDPDEILWRLRALCGLRNTLGSRIVAIGGLGAWSQPEDVIRELVEERLNLDVQTVSYDELGRLINEARADDAAVKRARRRADDYLKRPGTTLETERAFVDNAFLLDEVFRGIMKKAECGAITVLGCMGTIMPKAETSACLTLSLLNDAGYLAFCESDFVVIPSGILLAHVSGKPVFLQDPTYPHDGVITLAHCTAPRKMDGKNTEPARILTHFESDYGAAPKVEMRKGQEVTMIAPDFKFARWVGLLGTIEDNPFMDVCRSQIDVRFDCDSDLLAKRMPGFHWMLGYGDYRRELGYVLERVNIEWECLG